MIFDTISDASLDGLADHMREHPVPKIEPLPADSWVARSVMQKAIRRGMTELAQSAGLQLLLTDRRVLWRRLMVTAMEDLGRSGMQTVASVVAAYRSTKFRASFGEWPVIAELIREACAGGRCQAANDLWNIALHDPGLSEVKHGLADLSLPGVLELATGAADLGQRSSAVLFALGQGCQRLAEPPQPHALFEAFGIGESDAVAVCWEAYRITQVPLAALLLNVPDCPVQVIARPDDDLLPTTWIGRVPAFALDQYTRSGRQAIRQFSACSGEWHAFCEEAGIKGRDRLAAAGEILFRVEGAAVTRRASTIELDEIRARSKPLGCFMEPQNADEAHRLIRAQLPLIDKFRHELILPKSVA